ncbi:MAG: ABC transporter permease [Bacteroidota bacterium]
MSNTMLIAQREFMTRVKSKSFLITTFLAPIGVVVFIATLVFIMQQGSDTKKEIVIVDPSGLLDGELGARQNISYEFSTTDVEQLKKDYEEGKNDGVLEIVPLPNTETIDHQINFFSDERLALDEIQSIENYVERKIREFKVVALGIDQDKVALLRTDVDVNQETVIDKDKDVSADSTLIGGLLGGVIAYIMFFLILLYGGQVMKSVMEEKINRIVEVLISSVKPFELMMGKIIGVGAVGITQLLLWAILIGVAFTVGAGLIPQPDPATMTGGMAEAMVDPEVAAEIQRAQGEATNKVYRVVNQIGEMNWIKIFPLLLFYFVGGYLAYASIFAAIGSAVGEDQNDAQSLTTIIMLPLMISIYIGFSAFQAPNSTLATWGSIIPLSSSIVMPVRLPVDPAWWHILLSVALLAIFVLGMVWLAAKIYRVGILMYGKKASFKELGKWVLYKG